jgi:hypothetical protein
MDSRSNLHNDQDNRADGPTELNLETPIAINEEIDATIAKNRIGSGSSIG